MKLGFLFDTRFKEYKGDYYSTNLTQSLWERRYLRFFDEVVVIGRYVSLTEDPTGKLVKSSSDKVHFVCIPDSNNLHRIFTQKEQKKFIQENIKNCDRVICRGWWGVNACKQLNIPYMVEVVSCVWDSYWNHSALGKVVALPNYLLQKKVVKNAPFVMYVTQSFLQSRYPASHRAIGVSDVELKETSAEESEELLETRLRRISENQREIVIGTAGSVAVKYKGQQNVIAALAMLKKQGLSNFKYQLAGGGDTSYLKNKAQEYGVANQVEFIGPVPHDKMFNWYDSLDMYIQPSLQEGLPRAVVEAMSRALPCMGAKTGGIPELIEANYIFDRKGMPTQIAQLLKSITPQEMAKMARRNLEKSKEYSANLLEEKRNEFLKEFCDCSDKDSI